MGSNPIPATSEGVDGASVGAAAPDYTVRRGTRNGTSRGYFEIGVYRSKTPTNLGTLWRSAYQLGASGIFVVGQRWPDRQASDTVKAWKHVPLRRYEDIDALVESLPYDCPLIGVEMGGRPLGNYAHPERAFYLLGAEDSGLPPEVLARCHSVVELPSVRTASFNVAVAGSVVMYDRLRRGRAA